MPEHHVDVIDRGATIHVYIRHPKTEYRQGEHLIVPKAQLDNLIKKLRIISGD